MTATKDKIDDVRERWRALAPDLDTSPIEILGRIYRIASIVGRPVSKVFEAHDLERGEFDVIGTLYRAGQPHELSPTDLYRQLMITSGGLTYRLNVLERQGLVTRVKSNEDGRSLRVRLTKAGRERVLAAYADDLELEAQLLNGLNEADRKQLAALLRRLHLLVERNAETFSSPGSD
jgi:DNA-binding MarR family transcriptional regulator